MKKLLYLVIILFVVVGTYIGWHKWTTINDSTASKEFYSLVDSSKQDYLDLRLLKTIDWDELVYWSPYTNICDYNIDGLKPGDSKCRSSTDDGESYLLLLKNNKLVSTISIIRSKTNFDDKLNRIPKNKAIFVFSTKGQFPLLKLKD